VTWQRCRVHFMRNALAKVSKGDAETVAATIGSSSPSPPVTKPTRKKPTNNHPRAAVTATA